MPMVVNYKKKQTSDKSEQAIRQLSDKLSEIITEARFTVIDPDSYRGSAGYWEWSQILNI
jgi:hypothetical protein